MRKFYALVTILTIGLMFLSNSSIAQLRYKVDFRMLVDNLESAQPYAGNRTIAGVLLIPQVGFSQGNHSLMVGASMMDIFGSKKVLDEASLRAYYEYDDSKFKALAGIFSAYEIGSYPLSYFTTASMFMTDKVQGAYGRYKGKAGYIEAWFDWFKSDLSNLENSVDRFTATVAGEWWLKGFRLKGILMYTHFADRPVFETFSVFDRFQYDLNLGYDFARYQNVFSKILFTAGVNGDIDRARNDLNKGFEGGLGFQSEQILQWKGFILHNTVYVGQAQMRYYQQYPFVYFGSPFYQATFQDMLIAKYEYNFKWLTISANFAFFFTPETVANQQILTVSFKLDDIIKFKKKK